MKSFSFTQCRRNLKTQQSATILDLCLRKTRVEKSRDYRDVIVFETTVDKTFASTVKRNNAVFKVLRFKKRFRKASFWDELVWTVGLAGEIQSCGVVCKAPNSQNSGHKYVLILQPSSVSINFLLTVYATLFPKRVNRSLILLTRISNIFQEMGKEKRRTHTFMNRWGK